MSAPRSYIERNEPGHADSGGRVVVPFASDDEMRTVLSLLATRAPGSAMDGEARGLIASLVDSGPLAGEDWPDYCHRVRPLMAQAAAFLSRPSGTSEALRPPEGECSCAEIAGEDPRCPQHGMWLESVAAWTDDECNIDPQIDSFTVRDFAQRILATLAAQPVGGSAVGLREALEQISAQGSRQVSDAGAAMEMLRIARSALAHPASAAEGWQEIDENTPKMKGLMLWADTSAEDFPNWRMGSGYYSTAANAWIWEGETVKGWAFPPTHYKHLPAPPALSTDGAER